MDALAEISIQDFRAIQAADVALNGITVVSGINGCGKSTISKLLYHSFNVYENFNQLVGREHKNELININSQLNPFDYFDRLDEDRFYPGEKKNVARLCDDLDRIIEKNKAKSFTWINEVQKTNNFTRFPSFFYHFLKRANVAEDLNFEKIKELLSQKDELINKLSFFFESLHSSVNQIRDQSQSDLKNRNLKYLRRRLDNVFEQRNVLDQVDIRISGVPLYDRELNRLREQPVIEKALYIDTPMALGQRGEPHWNRLNSVLSESPDLDADHNEDLESMFNSILHGSITQDREFSRSLVFREDGAEAGYALSQCATGIKSFAILQRLLFNGYLNDKTLLIIDEPEVHLHPGWVVEYARVIVLLHKVAGVKFFIASHDPDMVNAISAISAKEEQLSYLNYYLAEEVSNKPYRYVYKSMRTDIDEIFRSFNMSYDKIAQYGTDPDIDFQAGKGE